ncbi:hypothetical protein C8N46_107198 [Kordia periserrulae]|uniref:Uncharacterized protein n=1 Tax=Kordia periserrulae TaxID=701523 RepID=A0A2T6BVV1_9FLAO|nr:hypothetical protein [Kordia periserrulae]PTX60191.1 hypothetical protein C8N46_107198 [Kordia periserrulae]
MKKKETKHLKLNKTKVSQLLELDLEKVKGGASGKTCEWDPYLEQYVRCNDYDYSTNGCDSTWST